MSEVQAVILNLSFPKSLEELYSLIKERGKLDMQALLEVNGLEESVHSWTLPKWIKSGDIVFFMHSKNSKFTIASLKVEFQREIGRLSSDQVRTIRGALNIGEELYYKYGGKIFMIGEIDEEAPFEYDFSEFRKYSPHYRGRICAYAKCCSLLKNPIDLSEFGKFIKLSCGGSITPVCGKQFEELKHLIMSRNNIPVYLEEASAMPIPLKDIDDNNWLSIASAFRNRFMYEIQFRSYYVDYFLKVLGDNKKIYSECECRKNGASHPSYVDNIISFGKYYLPVEVKVNKDSEHDLVGQVRKYCYIDKLYLEQNQKKLVNNEDVIRDKVLVIDTFGVYLYRNMDDSIEKLCSLDGLEIEDIFILRKRLFDLLDINEYFRNSFERRQ